MNEDDTYYHLIRPTFEEISIIYNEWFIEAIKEEPVHGLWGRIDYDREVLFLDHHWTYDEYKKKAASRRK